MWLVSRRRCGAYALGVATLLLWSLHVSRPRRCECEQTAAKCGYDMRALRALHPYPPHIPRVHVPRCPISTPLANMRMESWGRPGSPSAAAHANSTIVRPCIRPEVARTAARHLHTLKHARARRTRTHPHASHALPPPPRSLPCNPTMCGPLHDPPSEPSAAASQRSPWYGARLWPRRPRATPLSSLPPSPLRAARRGFRCRRRRAACPR